MGRVDSHLRCIFSTLPLLDNQYLYLGIEFTDIWVASYCHVTFVLEA